VDCTVSVYWTLVVGLMCEVVIDVAVILGNVSLSDTADWYVDCSLLSTLVVGMLFEVLITTAKEVDNVSFNDSFIWYVDWSVSVY